MSVSVIISDDRRALLGEDFVDVGAVAVLLGGATGEFGEDLVVDEKIAGGAFADAVAEGVVAVAHSSSRRDAGRSNR